MSRSTVVQTELGRELRELVRAYAREQGVSVSTFLRSLVLEHVPRARDVWLGLPARDAYQRGLVTSVQTDPETPPPHPGACWPSTWNHVRGGASGRAPCELFQLRDVHLAPCPRCASVMLERLPRRALRGAV